eukprot:COSAG01_NODE_513_length_16049_cov_57.758056_19_plen_64_part_00
MRSSDTVHSYAVHVAVSLWQCIYVSLPLFGEWSIVRVELLDCFGCHSSAQAAIVSTPFDQHGC